MTNFLEEDCDTLYLKRADDGYGQSRAAKVTHRPTGISRESHSKATPEENKQVAMQSLKAAVEGYRD